MLIRFSDASHPLPRPRFSQILHSFQTLTQPSIPKRSGPPQNQNTFDLVDNLVQFSTPTLAHLIALLCNQTQSHPDPKVSLIVVDSFSTLISNAFPRTTDSTSTLRKPGGMPSLPLTQYSQVGSLTIAST